MIVELGYEDMAHSRRFVYYRYEYSVNRQPKYVKVAVEHNEDPYFIVTAYRPDYVKERGKTKCVFGEDND